jgi:hypothetical protein
MRELPHPGPEVRSPSDQLRFAIHHFLKDVLVLDRPDDWAATLMMREMVRPTAAADVLVQRLVRPRFERMVETVRRLAPDLEGPELIATVFSVVGQCLHYKFCRAMSRRLVGEPAYACLDLDFLTDHITRFTLSALGVGRAEPVPATGEGGRPS